MLRDFAVRATPPRVAQSESLEQLSESMWAEFCPLSSCCRDIGRGTTKTLGEMPLIGPHDLTWAGSRHSETPGPWGWRAVFYQHQGLEGDQGVGWKVEEWTWGVWKELPGKGLCEPEAWFSPTSQEVQSWMYVFKTAKGKLEQQYSAFLATDFIV